MTTMRQLTTGLLAAASVMAISSGALAQDLFGQDWMMGPPQVRGLYFEGAGGATWTDDIDAETGPLPGVPGFEPGGHIFGSGYETGYALSARVGYGFPSGLRLEGEVAYRNNALNAVDIAPPPLAGTTLDGQGGRVQSVAFMANALYDWVNTSRFTPYVGLGGGALWVRQELDAGLTTTAEGGPGSVLFSARDESWVPALQGIAGVSIGITPSISATIDYRYLRGFDVDTSTNFGTSTESDYSNHTVFAGLRYTFGAPEAPPPAPLPEPPPPPPAPEQQVYLVFFDFDRSNLTPEGREVVNQVAARAQQPDAGVQEVQVSGHADRAGPADYNIALSQRRAETVRRGLIERGVPANEIVTRWFGESQPRVPTPDGVREPQNRRVEIVMM